MDVIAQVMGICFDFYNRTWFFDGYEFSLVEVWCFEMMGTLVAIFLVRFFMFWVSDIVRGTRMSDDESDNDIEDMAIDKESVEWDFYTHEGFDDYVDSFEIPDDWYD